MKLCNIHLINTRLFDEMLFEVGPNTTIICGLNASGKTTILEAVHLLITTRSNQSSFDRDLISYESDFLEVEGEFKGQNTQKKAKVLISKYHKKLSINGTNVSKASDYVGFAQVVSFGVQDVFSISNYPASRRKMFDMFICQLDKEYLLTLREYNILLREKNTLLKEESVVKNHLNLLETIDEKMVSLTQVINRKRSTYLMQVNNELTKVHKEISKCEEAHINLISSINDDNVSAFFKQNRNNDLKYKTATCGPHRDDYEFLINGQNILKYGSQGQKKTICFSLKIAFARVLESHFGESPIILLDDVFGELDPIRQNNLMKLLSGDAQVLITTPSLSDINEDLLAEADIINLNKEEER